MLMEGNDQLGYQDVAEQLQSQLEASDTKSVHSSSSGRSKHTPSIFGRNLEHTSTVCYGCRVCQTDGEYVTGPMCIKASSDGSTSTTSAQDAKLQQSQVELNGAKPVQQVLREKLSPLQNGQRTVKSMSTKNFNGSATSASHAICEPLTTSTMLIQRESNEESQESEEDLHVQNRTKRKASNCSGATMSICSETSTKWTKHRRLELVRNCNYDNVIFASVDKDKPVYSRSSGFVQACEKYDMYSDQCYDWLLANDASFAMLCASVPPQQFRMLKAQALEFGAAKHKVITYENAILRCKNEGTRTLEDEQGKKALGILCKFLSKRGLQTKEFIYKVFQILTMADHKKNSLLILGASDAGKTLFSTLITAVYRSYEIGHVNPQASPTQVDSFWLSECYTSSIKRVEELFIPTPTIAQLWKQLL